MSHFLHEPVIVLPPNLGVPEALALIANLQTLECGNSLTLDFSSLQWVEPGGMLTAAIGIRRLVHTRKELLIEARGLPAGINYVSHMGFFHACSIPWGKGVGEAPGGLHYLPITRMDFPEVGGVAREEGACPQTVIERESARLAATLCQESDTPTHRLLSFCLTELLRNSFEHSSASGVWYAAQLWPTRGEVEVAILDDGVGIRQSLLRNPAHKVPDDVTAVHLALLPGISASPEAGRETYAYWDNSGFGLYMTSQLALRKGTFTIGTGDSTLLLSTRGKQVLPGPLVGTMVVFRTKTDWGEMGRALEDIRRRGDLIAASLKGAHTHVSTTASRLVREYFTGRQFSSGED